jgi:hypothetical protein
MPQTISGTCAHCGAPYNRTTAVGTAQRVKPRPGDIVVCLHCGAATRVTKERELKALTDDDISKLPLFEQADVLRAQFAVRASQGRA